MPERPPLVPPPLRPGDTIAVIAPAGQLRDPAGFHHGISILGEMGFVPRFPPQLWPGTGYLADTDNNRAEEFNRAWADPEISAVIALRGGYGCLRMATMIDLELVRRQPKLLIGFSDLTILHNYLHQQTGLISLHGPTLSTLASSSQDSRARFHQCLKGNWRHPLFCKGGEVLRRSGTVRGRLIGGNLSSLLTLIGTPFAPVFSDGILFLEDVGEPLYRIDRMLTQLWLSGKLENVAGIILGDFSLNQEMAMLDTIRHHEAIWNRILELTHHHNKQIPVWGGFPFGHGPVNMTLPHGAMAVMDNDECQLSFL